MNVQTKVDNLALNKIENPCLNRLEAIVVAVSDTKVSSIICFMDNQTYSVKHCKILIIFQISP